MKHNNYVIGEVLVRPYLLYFVRVNIEAIADDDVILISLGSWLGDTLGALVGDADGSQLGTALGIHDGCW